MRCQCAWRLWLRTKPAYSYSQDHKLPWAHPGPTGCTDLLSAVNALKPSCLVRAMRSAACFVSSC